MASSPPPVVVWIEEQPSSQKSATDEISTDSNATVIETAVYQLQKKQQQEDQTSVSEYSGDVTISADLQYEPLTTMVRDPYGIAASTASDPVPIDDLNSTSTVLTAATEDPRIYRETDKQKEDEKRWTEALAQQQQQQNGVTNVPYPTDRRITNLEIEVNLVRVQKPVEVTDSNTTVFHMGASSGRGGTGQGIGQGSQGIGQESQQNYGSGLNQSQVSQNQNFGSGSQQNYDQGSQQNYGQNQISGTNQSFGQNQSSVPDQGNVIKKPEEWIEVEATQKSTQNDQVQANLSANINAGFGSSGSNPDQQQISGSNLDQQQISGSTTDQQQISGSTSDQQNTDSIIQRPNDFGTLACELTRKDEQNGQEIPVQSFGGNLGQNVQNGQEIPVQSFNASSQLNQHQQSTDEHQIHFKAEEPKNPDNQWAPTISAIEFNEKPKDPIVEIDDKKKESERRLEDWIQRQDDVNPAWGVPKQESEGQQSTEPQTQVNGSILRQLNTSTPEPQPGTEKRVSFSEQLVKKYPESPKDSKTFAVDAEKLVHGDAKKPTEDEKAGTETKWVEVQEPAKIDEKTVEKVDEKLEKLDETIGVVKKEEGEDGKPTEPFGQEPKEGQGSDNLDQKTNALSQESKTIEPIGQESKESQGTDKLGQGIGQESKEGQGSDALKTDALSQEAKPTEPFGQESKPTEPLGQETDQGSDALGQKAYASQGTDALDQKTDDSLKIDVSKEFDALNQIIDNLGKKSEVLGQETKPTESFGQESKEGQENDALKTEPLGEESKPTEPLGQETDSSKIGQNIDVFDTKPSELDWKASDFKNDLNQQPIEPSNDLLKSDQQPTESSNDLLKSDQQTTEPSESKATIDQPDSKPTEPSIDLLKSDQPDSKPTEPSNDQLKSDQPDSKPTEPPTETTSNIEIQIFKPTDSFDASNLNSKPEDTITDTSSQQILPDTLSQIDDSTTIASSGEETPEYERLQRKLGDPHFGDKLVESLKLVSEGQGDKPVVDKTQEEKKEVEESSQGDVGQGKEAGDGAKIGEELTKNEGESQVGQKDESQGVPESQLEQKEESQVGQKDSNFPENQLGQKDSNLPEGQGVLPEAQTEQIPESELGQKDEGQKVPESQLEQKDSAIPESQLEQKEEGQGASLGIISQTEQTPESQKVPQEGQEVPPGIISQAEQTPESQVEQALETQEKQAHESQVVSEDQLKQKDSNHPENQLGQKDSNLTEGQSEQKDSAIPGNQKEKTPETQGIPPGIISQAEQTPESQAEQKEETIPESQEASENQEKQKEGISESKPTDEIKWIEEEPTKGKEENVKSEEKPEVTTSQEEIPKTTVDQETTTIQETTSVPETTTDQGVSVPETKSTEDIPAPESQQKREIISDYDEPKTLVSDLEKYAISKGLPILESSDDSKPKTSLEKDLDEWSARLNSLSDYARLGSQLGTQNEHLLCPILNDPCPGPAIKHFEGKDEEDDYRPLRERLGESRRYLKREEEEPIRHEREGSKPSEYKHDLNVIQEEEEEPSRKNSEVEEGQKLSDQQEVSGQKPTEPSRQQNGKSFLIDSLEQDILEQQSQSSQRSTEPSEQQKGQGSSSQPIDALEQDILEQQSQSSQRSNEPSEQQSQVSSKPTDPSEQQQSQVSSKPTESSEQQNDTKPTEPPESPKKERESLISSFFEKPKTEETQWITQDADSSKVVDVKSGEEAKDLSSQQQQQQTQWITQEAQQDVQPTKPSGNESMQWITEGGNDAKSDTKTNDNQPSTSQHDGSGVLAAGQSGAGDKMELDQGQKPPTNQQDQSDNAADDEYDVYQKKLIQNTREALALVDKLYQDSLEKQERRKRHLSGGPLSDTERSGREYTPTSNRPKIGEFDDLEVEVYRVNAEMMEEPKSCVLLPDAKLLILDKQLGLTLMDLQSKETKRCAPADDWRDVECATYMKKHNQILLVYEQKIENQFYKYLARFDLNLQMLTKCEAPKYLQEMIVNSCRVCYVDETDCIYLAVNTPNNCFIYELNAECKWTEVHCMRGKQVGDIAKLAAVGPVTELLVVESTKRHILLLGIYNSAMAERALIAACAEPAALCTDEHDNLIVFDRATNLVGVHSRLNFERIHDLVVVGRASCSLSAREGFLAVMNVVKKEFRICKY